MELEDAKPKGRWKTSDGHSMRSLHSKPQGSVSETDKLTAQQRETYWLKKHPVAQRAYVIYMTGLEPSVDKAIQRAIAETPNPTVKARTILEQANNFRWGRQRAIIRACSKDEIDRATLHADKAAQELVDIARREIEIAKPGAPRDSKAELDFLLELRVVWRQNAKDEKDGTKAVNWLKALGALDQKIQSVSTSQVEDPDDDGTDYTAKAAEAQQYTPDVDLDVPQSGRAAAMSADFAARIQLQYEEHQAALRGEEPASGTG